MGRVRPSRSIISQDRSQGRSPLIQSVLLNTKYYIKSSVCVVFACSLFGRVPKDRFCLALADDLRNVSFAQIGVSGMLGLGFPAIAAISSALGLPVIFNIASALDASQQFFSFRLGRSEGTTVGSSTFNIGTNALFGRWNLLLTSL